MACCLRFLYCIESLHTGAKSYTSNPDDAEVFARKDKYKVTCKSYTRWYRKH